MNNALRITGRAVGYVLASVLLLLTLALITFAFLLATERGTKITLGLVERFVPGEIEIQHGEGTLLGELRLESIHYRHQGIKAHIEDLELAWQPGQLINRDLYLNNIAFSAMQLEVEPQPDTTDPEAEEPFTLPEINLPVNIYVERLQLKQINLTLGEFNQHIDVIELRANSEGYKQHIEHFLLVAPPGEVTLSGRIRTADEYPMDLHAIVHTTLPDIQSLQLDANIQGDLDALNIEAITQGLVDSELNAELFEVLDMEQLNWDASILVNAIQVPELSEFVSDLEVRVTSQGSLETLHVSMDGEINTLEYGDIDLNSSITYSDMHLIIHNLSADLDSLPAHLALGGEAQLGEQLHVDIQGQAEGLGFTISELTISADGNEQGAETLTVEARTPQGDISVEGSLFWQPYLRWDLALEVDNVDLSDIEEGLTGELNGSISTQGQLDDVLLLDAQILSLEGNIFNNALHGSGSVHIHGDHFQADSLDIQWGDASIQADGRYSPEALDLQWDVQIPNLATLLPNAGGQFQSTGEVTGSQDLPQLTISLDANELRYETYSVSSVNADLSLDGTLASLPTGTLSALGIELGGTEISRIDATFTAQEQHEINIAVNYEELQASTTLLGDWNFETKTWDGVISRLQLRYPDLGRWQLPQAAQLVASPEQASLQGFCLLVSTRESEICADFNWLADGNELIAQISADDLPYQLFDPWLPDDLVLLGEFSIDAQMEQAGGQLNADARLSISNTSIRAPAQELRVDFEAGDLLRITGNEETLQINVELLSEQLEGGLEAHSTIENILTDDIQINGELGLDVRSMTLISVLVPELQNVVGHVNGRIDFSGPPQDLTIGGGIELRDGAAEVPATGLELRNMNVSLNAPTSNEAPFTLQGQMNAGEGELRLGGEFYLREQRAFLSVEGDAFPALNTRDLSVTVAPDLEIEYTPELLKLRGEVFVPRARITPPDIESVDSISSDTVLVGGEGGPYDTSAVGLPIDMDLTVRLGDDVQVSAFGFEGQLQGGLRIIEQSGQETTASGNIEVASGLYEIYGQNLNIERGRLIFTGGPVANPGLDLRVERAFDTESVTVGARIGGTLQNPTLNLFSSPAMQDSAILSYLIFGRGPGQGNTGEANMLAQATLALGMSGGNRLGERLSDTFGVDDISLDAEDSFESTSLYIGKQISSRLYIKYGVGLVEPVSTFFIQYRLTDSLNFESQTGNEQSGADLFYTIER